MKRKFARQRDETDINEKNDMSEKRKKQKDREK